MRQKDICFMPLGGAQSVGRSCYYLRLGQSNILLDCGLQRINGVTCSPDFRSLLTSQFMESIQQLDHVYISQRTPTMSATCRSSCRWHLRLPFT